MSSRVAGTEDSTVEAVAEQLVSGLADLSERMGDREFALIANDSLLALVAGLERASRQLEALIVRAEGKLASRCFGEGRASLARPLGCRDGLEVLELVTRRSRTVLRQRVRLAEDLQTGQGYSGGEIAATFPAIAEAFYAGDVSFETAQVIAESLRKVPGYVDADRVAEAERCIVNQAAGYPEERGLASAASAGGDDGDSDGDGAVDGDGVAERLPVAYDTVREICAYWTTALDQDGPEPDEESVLTRRSFRMGRMWRGLVPVRGSLTPEVAALLGNLITAINSPKSATNTTDPTSDLVGDPASGQTASVPGGTSGGDADDFEPDLGAVPGDARSQGQKMHDSLMLIAQMAAQAAPMPSLGGAPVTVLIQTTQAELAASVQGEPASCGAAWLHGADGVPVPVGFASVRHSMCAGATQRVLVGETGRVLGLESPSRLFTAVQRRAITARDGGCVIPGCTVPGAWCEVHHVVGWAAGGKTTPENGVLLCWWHHRSVEAGGWHVRMVEGLPEVRGPKWWDPDMVWRPARSVWATAMERLSGRTVPGQQRRARTG